MDPDSVKSTLSNLAFGNVMAAAARDYQKELLTQEKVQSSASANEEVDLDELMDDPELEKLHADRIAALKKEAEKREAMKGKGMENTGRSLKEISWVKSLEVGWVSRSWGKDDFATRTLEVFLIKKGIISEKKNEDDEDDIYDESRRRSVRSSLNHDSDSD
ncbi:Thioredoxin domain-containing protein PLP3A [Hibiscus syriacus]|uniref:Thioredoxin domain-containing protein PLP3A n=1 Tax=Hibiscus syriacus TaxID=106335 RepID=A0A6A2WSR6_HIBSY|nr:Thioredoxin domain-containing protein PLP3A [Hibiscus syriacus]